ncbi:hypothetical protein sos41_05910 [Alphaproteobacteria bacterium SO-S41]|nr:hypothetical protein sos41_05910 [Alphaproteobacteria bacterium SO-S41]
MKTLHWALAGAWAAAALSLPAAAKDGATLYEDRTHGFSTMIPDGWSNPAGGLVTSSADGSVRCSITAMPVKQTAGMTQDEVNAAMGVYTSDIWKTQFFTGGATGEITDSGITKLEQYDAPWARGTIIYPGTAFAKFGVLMVQAPGKLATVTCTGEPTSYDTNLRGLTTVLNYLRPL